MNLAGLIFNINAILFLSLEIDFLTVEETPSVGNAAASRKPQSAFQWKQCWSVAAFTPTAAVALKKKTVSRTEKLTPATFMG